MSQMKQSAFAVILGGALLLLAAPAWAQGKAAPENLNFAKNLSFEEMSERSKGELQEMQEVLNGTIQLAEDTRSEEKDLLKLNCINDRIPVIRGFVNVSEQSQGRLGQAIKQKDREGAEHQYSLIVIAGTKVDNLGVEARSCAGEVLRYSGETVVEKEVSGDIAALDPTNVISEEDVLFTTEEATPYQ